MTGSRRIGLALSGGGARGLAHIGVLKVLEREGIAIAALAGTSMGGLVGTLYAAGIGATELEEEALRRTSPRQLIGLIDPAPLRRGLLQGQRVTEYLHELLGERTFDDLRIPLRVIAADLHSGRPVILQEGRLVDAVRATISVPGIFVPVQREGQLLVDGGVLNNLPSDVLRATGVDCVIAVDVLSCPGDGLLARPFQMHMLPSAAAETIDLFWQSFALMLAEIQRLHLAQDPPEVMICPAVPAEITMLGGFGRCAEIIAAGEKAAEEMLPQIVACLASEDGAAAPSP